MFLTSFNHFHNLHVCNYTVSIMLNKCKIQMLVKYNFFIDLQITSNSPKVTHQNDSVIEIKCSDHIVSALVILDVLLVATYVYGLYIFRSKLREYLSTFIETVSFDYCVNHTLDYIIF